MSQLADPTRPDPSAALVPAAPRAVSQRIASPNAVAPRAGNELLFPQAYRGTLAGGTRALLPALRRWIVALLVVITLLLVASVVVWRRATSELRAASEQAVSEQASGTASEGTPPNPGTSTPAGAPTEEAP